MAGVGAIAMTAAGAVATGAQPAAATGENIDDWTWTGNRFDGVARIRYIERYRMNISDDAALPDNLDIYGSTCVTVPFSIGRVEMTSSYQIDLAGPGAINVIGGAGWGIVPGTTTITNTWGVDKPAWDGVQTHWSRCSQYAKAVAFGDDNFNDPGRVHVTTQWNGRMIKVRHRVSLNYFSQFGPIRFAPDLGEERGPWWDF